MKFKKLKVGKSYILNIRTLNKQITDYGYAVVYEPIDKKEDNNFNLVDLKEDEKLLLVNREEAFLLKKTEKYAVFKAGDIDETPSPKFKLSIQECEQATRFCKVYEIWCLIKLKIINLKKFLF